MSDYTDPTRRHDFVLLFDVMDGNPNGDPDAGNLPRIDPETMQGLVTDAAIKRKVRNYVDTLRGHESRFKIYVQNRGILNAQHRRAYEALESSGDISLPPSEEERAKAYYKKPPSDTLKQVRQWMCHNFYDIRTFGAVMSTDVNCGQVRGPAQFTFARSVDKIFPLDVSITRIALTNATDIRGGADSDSEARAGQMGRKSIVPYGLYRAYGFFNPYLARDTGFDTQDLELLFQALQGMWDMDRSASRGLMACRGLFVFSHSTALGNAPAHQLFDHVSVARKDDTAVARSFQDYAVRVADALPDGVSLTQLA